MLYGYNGQFLRINLSSGKISREARSEDYFRLYYGGRNIIAGLLLHEVPAHTDPLSPANKLIFATGVLTGNYIAGSGRHSVGAKSPLTGAYGDSEAGGFWGQELKRAGYDALIVEGRAERPVYIAIKDGDVRIEAAGDLWGKTTLEAEDILLKKEGKVKIAQIGPAGESLCSIACIVHELSHFAGRCGLGAVMGSKNLRAIAVKGSKILPVADKTSLVEVARYMAKNYMQLEGALVKEGTMRSLLPQNISGGLPTRNFSAGSFTGAENLSPQVLDQYLLKRETCYACPIRCGRQIEIKDGPYKTSPRYKGPEYESVAAFGSNCGIDDIQVVIKANEICNANGLDVISAGVSVSFAMECVEKNLIDPAFFEGLDIRFGSPDFLHLLEQMARRRGPGSALADGVKKAAAYFGTETECCAVHVKGQEAPMHDPRMKKSMALGYSISPTGADHAHSVHDPMYTKETRQVQDLRLMGFDYQQYLPSSDFSLKKAELFRHASVIRYLVDCLVVCLLVPWSYNDFVKAIRAVTGWDASIEELTRVSERSMVLPRLFNLREGLSARDDRLCPRFHEPLTDGPLAGSRVDEAELTGAVARYYELMGWDGNGCPTAERLLELNLTGRPGGLEGIKI